MKTSCSDHNIEAKSVRKQYLLRPATANAVKQMAISLGMSENEIINRLIDTATKKECN